MPFIPRLAGSHFLQMVNEYNIYPPVGCDYVMQYFPYPGGGIVATHDECPLPLQFQICTEGGGLCVAYIPPGKLSQLPHFGFCCHRCHVAGKTVNAAFQREKCHTTAAAEYII